ncbi:TPA: hypothetical protein ACRZTS_005007, partial [Escherichia coli]
YLCDKSKSTNSVLISFLFLLILCLSCFYLILFFLYVYYFGVILFGGYMSISMQQIDSCIETTINRLSSEAGTMVSNFYLDLRSPGRQRITEKLVEQSIDLCRSRGIYAEREGNGLLVRVDLRTCYLNPGQAEMFNIAIGYTRSVHGNHL